MEQRIEIYKIDFGSGSIYFQVLNDNEVVCLDKTVTMPKQRLLDFIATAKVLGLNAGKI